MRCPRLSSVPRFVANSVATGCLVLAAMPRLSALDRPEVTFEVFQFPRDQMPRIDGNVDDWAMVPERYAIGMDQLIDADRKHAAPDPKNLDVRVRVGWVEGLNRLYFLYEAYDDYWDFARSDLHNDTFEIVVDGDASGGPLIDSSMAKFWTPEAVGALRSKNDERIPASERRWSIHGVHAQNYHVFTPAMDKDWALAWGVPTWTKDFPHANAAYSFNFKPGESGRLVAEFWITPFDYAGAEGAQRAVESVLKEGKIIGLGWIVIDYDDVAKRGNNGFWTLSRHRSMFGDATMLPAFRLMPLESALHSPVEARWSFELVNMDRRVVAFKDESLGEIKTWKWSFGDGSESTEQHPVHHYEKGGNYVVILEVEGPAGRSKRSKVWDVQLK